MSKTITLQLINSTAALAEKALDILQRALSDRMGLTVLRADTAPGTGTDTVITLGVDETLSLEEYSIQTKAAVVSISGGDPAGLLYGVGRFIHESLCGGNSLKPCADVRSAPSYTTRGLYFAHNFHNWYRSAPLEDLIRYAYSSDQSYNQNDFSKMVINTS